MSAFFDVIIEIWKNRYRMLRVVWYDIKIENRSLYLGTLWKVLTPFLEIGTFWLVFGLGIRGGAPVDGFPFFIWLLAGITPWFFINRAISNGASSINSKGGIIFKIKYPIPTVPVGSVLHGLYDHVILLAIMFVIFMFYGILPSLHWLNLLYYILYAFVFIAAVTMILSVVVRLAHDFSRLIPPILRMVFFLTPILWQDTYMPEWVLRIFAFNPVRYIVMGFRGSLLYGYNFFDHPLRIAFFWPATLTLLVLACWLQKKFSRRFADWM